MNSKTKKILFGLLGLFILAFILYLNKNFSFQKLINLNFLFLTSLILTYYFHDIVSAYRWGEILNLLEQRKVLPFKKYLFYFSFSSILASFSFHELSNFGARVGSLLIEKISFRKTANSYLIEKIFTLLNLLSILWISLIYFFKLLPANICLLLLLASFFTVYFLLSHNKINFTKLYYLTIKLIIKVGKIFPYIKNKINSQKLDEQNKNVILETQDIKKLYLLSIIKFLVYSTFVWLAFKSFNINIDPRDIILAMPIIQLSVLFAFTPGALGIFEAGWFIILKLIGIAAVDITTFIIGFRLLSYLAMSINVAVNYLLFLSVKKHRNHGKIQ